MISMAALRRDAASAVQSERWLDVSIDGRSVHMPSALQNNGRLGDSPRRLMRTWDDRQSCSFLVKSTRRSGLSEQAGATINFPCPTESPMRLVCLIALAVLAGCSSQPQTESSEIAASGVASDATSASALAAAAATEDEFQPPSGYKRRVENGQIIYCTKIVVLGSRFSKDDCRTQEQLEYMEQQKGLMRAEFERQKSICSSAPGCASN